MGYYIEKLRRPYDFEVLVDAYVYSIRKDFVHADFARYYSALRRALEAEFGLRVSPDTLSDAQLVLWRLFSSTAESLLRVSTPLDGYLESTLVFTVLKRTGERGKAAEQLIAEIDDLARSSQAAHRNLLYTPFYRDLRTAEASGDLG